MILFMGIDPGVSGGLTILRDDGSVYVTIGFDGAWTHEQFVEVLVKALLRPELDPGIALEKVGYMGRRVMPDGTVKKDGGQGAFTFGQVDGLIRGTILARARRIVEVRPMMWQSSLRCLTAGDKNVTKRRATELWPHIEWTHKTADSALIAEWHRRRILSRRSLL